MRRVDVRRVLPRPQRVAAGVDHERGGRLDAPEDRGVARVDPRGAQRRIGGVRRPPAVLRHRDALPVGGRPAVPVLVAAAGVVAGDDLGGVGDARRDPGPVGGAVLGELVVRGVQEEAGGLLHAGLDQAVADLADVQPRRRGAVEVDLHVGQGREGVDGVVELREPGRGGGRRVDLGRLAPVHRPVEVRVVRDDPETVGFEDDRRRPVADPGGEPVDPGRVRRRVRGAAGGVLRTVAEGQVVGDEDRQLTGLRRGGDEPVDVGAHLLRRAAGEPGRRRDAAQQLRVRACLPAEGLRGLQRGAVRVGVERRARRGGGRWGGGGRCRVGRGEHRQRDRECRGRCQRRAAHRGAGAGHVSPESSLTGQVGPLPHISSHFAHTRTNTSTPPGDPIRVTWADVHLAPGARR